GHRDHPLADPHPGDDHGHAADDGRPQVVGADAGQGRPQPRALLHHPLPPGQAAERHPAHRRRRPEDALQGGLHPPRRGGQSLPLQSRPAARLRSRVHALRGGSRQPRGDVLRRPVPAPGGAGRLGDAVRLRPRVHRRVRHRACRLDVEQHAPFDTPEGESEIIGYFLEYSSLKSGMFYTAEYAETVVIAGIVTTIFLGGYHIPWLEPTIVRTTEGWLGASRIAWLAVLQVFT